MRLIDLEEEEERDKEGVKILLRKYTKLLKFLFNKYAMSRSAHKRVESFDYYSDKTINVAELSKLLRDHDSSLPSKDELQTIVRLLNMKLVKRSDLTALDYGGFVQFLL